MDRSTSKAIGIYDFSYAPYALGDALTWQVNLMCEAYERNVSNIESILMADAQIPSNSFQRHITSRNYKSYLNNLLQTFLCTQNLSSLKIFNCRYAFNEYLSINTSAVSWPSFNNHLKKQLDYSSHKKINRFYKTHRFIPELQIPIGYKDWVTHFLMNYLSGKYVVCVNIRQARLKQMPQSLYRDSPADVWFSFIQDIYKLNPNVAFILVGGYEEIEDRFSALPNVIISREIGLSLAHELALLKVANLFMGTSSGFAAMATFSGAPYIITNYDSNAASETEIEIGARHYPFAKKNQILDWGIEKLETLTTLFLEIYNA